METWNGIISLLIACIELILLVNILALAEKNKTSRSGILIIALLFCYQLIEFIICHFNSEAPALIYTAFVIISFLPPLSFYHSANLIRGGFSSRLKLIFLPSIFFSLLYLLMIDDFDVTACSVFYASFNYPLSTLFGIFFYLPVAASMLHLYLQIKNEKSGKRTFLSKIILAGYIIALLPAAAAFILAAFDSYFLLSIIESITGKFALVPALCIGFVSIYGRKPKTLR